MKIVITKVLLGDIHPSPVNLATVMGASCRQFA
jgi:hypothetical protein